MEHRLREEAGGEYRWFRTSSTVLRDRGGRIVEWFGTSTDVHDLHLLQDCQRVLVTELQHRSRDLLAMVHAITRRTLESNVSPDEFGARLAGRLAALGRVQEMLVPGSPPVMMADLVRTELRALEVEPDSPHTVLGGPAIEMPAEAVQALALVLHELVTDALAHGALMMPTGRLGVLWEARVDGPGRRLRLDWHESGISPPPTHPRRGYGRDLIEEVLPAELGADTRLAFEPDGIRWTIELPLAAPAAEAPDP